MTQPSTNDVVLFCLPVALSLAVVISPWLAVPAVASYGYSAYLLWLKHRTPTATQEFQEAVNAKLASLEATQKALDAQMSKFDIGNSMRRK